jgi:hypothetical protein
MNLVERRDEIIKQYGAWTAHNIHLGDGLYTYESGRPDFDRSITAYSSILKRILQVVSDTVDRPLNQLRVLDLGCLEGIYGIEFALHGAEVVGLEGREANLRKAMFAAEALSLSNATFVQDDVRNLSRDKHGQFDVVLCVGILYHLDAPDVFGVLERIFDVCKRVTIIDTHVGLRPNRSLEHRGVLYHGWSYTEFPPNTPPETKREKLWASLDNERSFWFSRPSLINFLANVGFASVYDCHMPAFAYTGREGRDRDTLVAVKGPREQLKFAPESESLPAPRWTETSRQRGDSSQEAYLASLDLSAGQKLRRKLQALLGR